MSETPPSNLSDDLRELRWLRRSRNNRVVAGVLGGVAGRLGIDPLVLRIVTVVLAVFGGVGVVLYAIGWLLIPDEDAQTSIAEQALGRDGRSADFGTVALAIGLVIAALISAGGMFGSGTGWLLMILTVGGAIVLLRRQDGDGDGAEQAEPGIDYPGFPGYVPATDEPEPAVTDAEPSDTAGQESTPAPADTPHAPPAPAEAPPAAAEAPPAAAEAPPAAAEAPPAAAEAPPAATTVSGIGWPEGPDWAPPSAADYLEPSAPPPADVATHRSRLGRLTLSAVVVALGVLAINDATWAAIPISAYVATALAIVGAGLLIGTWYGRARGLIGLGIVLTLALPLAVVADGLNLRSVGSVTITPQSVGEVPTGLQDFGVGSVLYDLSQLDLTDGETVTLDVEQGVGELRIVVPENADVTIDAEVGLGAIELFETRSGGPGNSRQFTDLGPDGQGGGEITLDLELGVGRVAVDR